MPRCARFLVVEGAREMRRRQCPAWPRLVRSSAAAHARLTTIRSSAPRRESGPARAERATPNADRAADRGVARDHRPAGCVINTSQPIPAQAQYPILLHACQHGSPAQYCPWAAHVVDVGTGAHDVRFGLTR